MYRLLSCFVIFMMLIIPAQAQEYLWPTVSSRYLSSTFGETRAAHFHAGLDIKTWGREGFRVFASRDGIVHRLLVTERGYGKAVYLKHGDGTYSVYAHLQRFNDELQAYVDSIRLQDHSFEIEIYTEHLNWLVKQGQVIGYSGSSGVGPPHLHFELRDSLENPFNALSTNLTIQDDIPPVISTLIAEPLTSKSLIDGKPYSQVFSPTKIQDGIYDFGTIKVFGQAGLALNTYDLANDVYNKYAVYKLILTRGSDTLFYQQLDTFSYEDEGANMFLDRIAPFGSYSRGHQRLYEKDGAVIPFYQISKPASRIVPSDTAITYTITSADYFGNISEATVTIQKDSAANNNEAALGNPLSEWYWHENWASPDLKNTIDLSDLSLGRYWSDNQKLIFIEKDLPHIFARLTPGELQEVVTTDYRLLLRFGPNSLFDTLTTAVHYKLAEDKIHISAQPKMLPVKSDYKIEFYLPDHFPNYNYRLFRINNTGRLSYVKSYMTGRTIHAWPSDFGEFIIMVDDIAPSAWNFRIYRTDYGQWQAAVSVGDALSGIDSAASEFVINGVKGIAEYDYEEKLLIYHLPNFIPQKNNTAQVRLTDKAGNTRVFHFEK